MEEKRFKVDESEWFDGLLRQVAFQVSNMIYIGSLLVVPSLNVVKGTSLGFNPF